MAVPDHRRWVGSSGIPYNLMNTLIGHCPYKASIRGQSPRKWLLNHQVRWHQDPRCLTEIVHLLSVRATDNGSERATRIEDPRASRTTTSLSVTSVTLHHVSAFGEPKKEVVVK